MQALDRLWEYKDGLERAYCIPVEMVEIEHDRCYDK